MYEVKSKKSPHNTSGRQNGSRSYSVELICKQDANKRVNSRP